MSKQKFLTQVYDLDTPDATRELYDNWSASYDAEISENGYATPARVAEALSRHLSDKSSAILDFGCGTGLSGLALRSEGFTQIDGADLSADMLKGAAEKRAYHKLWQVELDDTIPSGYDAITATGVIGVGAAPIEVLDAILKALAPGGLFALSFNDHALADPQFEGRLRALLADGAARLLFQEYGPHLPGINLKSNVYVLQKS